MTDADATFEELAIADPASGTRALVAPGRGGMVTALDVDGRAMLYLDRATFLDPAKNVRGGNPVLFPTPGKLAQDRWSRDGKSGVLGQHGFARNAAWRVIDRAHDAVSLRLEPTDASRAAYPWSFRLDLTYRVHDRALLTSAVLENRSSTAMPCGFGFHPYFALRDKSTFVLESDATRAFDNVTKNEVAFDARKLDLTSGEIDLHLRDHASRTMTFALDGVARVAIDGGVERPHWVLWSLPGRDFVCVEPWTCPGDAMNTGERLMHLAAGETRALSFSYRVAA